MQREFIQKVAIQTRHDYHKWETYKQSHYICIKMGRFTKRSDKMHGTKNEAKRKRERIAIALKSFVGFEFEFWVNKKMLIFPSFAGFFFSFFLWFGFFFWYVCACLQCLNPFSKLTLGCNTIKADFYPVCSVGRNISLFLLDFYFSFIFGLPLTWKVWNCILKSGKHTTISSKRSRFSGFSFRANKGKDFWCFICDNILLSMWRQNECGRCIYSNEWVEYFPEFLFLFDNVLLCVRQTKLENMPSQIKLNETIYIIHTYTDVD